MENNNINMVMYHYVRDFKKSKYPQIKGMDISEFREQIRFIKKHFTTISPKDLIEYYKNSGRVKLPENPILLTFDDGYIDNYQYVFEELEKNNIKGAFFPVTKAVRDHKLLDVNKIHYILATADIDMLVKDLFEKIDEYRDRGQLTIDGKEFPSNQELFSELAVANRWDPKEVIFVKRVLQNKLPEQIRSQIATDLFEKYVGISEEEFAKKLYLDEEKIMEMKKEGQFFGIHGSGHYWLAKLAKDEMEKDIINAIEYFGNMGAINKEEWVMNYPYGNYSQDIVEFIKRNNCIFGVTVEAKKGNLKEDNQFLLPRWDANDLPPRADGKALLS